MRTCADVVERRWYFYLKSLAIHWGTFFLVLSPAFIVLLLISLASRPAVRSSVARSHSRNFKLHEWVELRSEQQMDALYLLMYSSRHLLRLHPKSQQVSLRGRKLHLRRVRWSGGLGGHSFHLGCDSELLEFCHSSRSALRYDLMINGRTPWFLGCQNRCLVPLTCFTVKRFLGPCQSRDQVGGDETFKAARSFKWSSSRSSGELLSKAAALCRFPEAPSWSDPARLAEALTHCKTSLWKGFHGPMERPTLRRGSWGSSGWRSWT